MKLLLITKRHVVTKDVIGEAYGRQYELGVRLAQAGWEVKAYCLDYRSPWHMETVHAGGVEWHSYSVLPYWYSWRQDIAEVAKSWKPHVILGCGDPVHITAGYKASSKENVPLALDLHDNLESFRAIGIPGLRQNFREAVRQAALVMCVSEPLKRMVEDRYRPRGQLSVLEHAIPLGPPQKACHTASSRLPP